MDRENRDNSQKSSKSHRINKFKRRTRLSRLKKKNKVVNSESRNDNDISPFKNDRRNRINHNRISSRVTLRRKYSLTLYDNSIFNPKENYGDNMIEMHHTSPSEKRQAPTAPSGELAQAVMEPQLETTIYNL